MNQYWIYSSIIDHILRRATRTHKVFLTPSRRHSSTIKLFVKLSCQLLHHCHWAIFVCSKFPYLFAQDSQHLFVQNSQLYKFVCLLVYLFPQPQNPIFTSQSLASVFWKMKNWCWVVRKSETGNMIFFGDLLTVWQLDADLPYLCPPKK